MSPLRLFPPPPRCLSPPQALSLSPPGAVPVSLHLLLFPPPELSLPPLSPPSRICHSASRSPRHRVPAPALPLAVRAQVGVARGTKKARPGHIAARPRGRGGSPVPAGSV